jgi:hypothetical protein
VRVALLDSGVDDHAATQVLAAAAFLAAPDGRVAATGAVADMLGHGNALAAIVRSEAPGAELLVAQLFTEKLACTPLQVASALDWAVSRGAQLVNMSFGLSHDRPVLSEACARAVARDVVLVAAAPARGDPVFPAAYPGVIRATGDARCRPGEISWLDSEQADFGGCVQSSVSAVSGASVGCARVCAKIASYLKPGVMADRVELIQWLVQQARYHGRERRTR